LTTAADITVAGLRGGEVTRNRAGSWRWVRLCVIATFALVASFACASAPAPGPPPPSGSCDGPHWVASWGAAQSDASIPFDATFSPLPVPIGNETIRDVITPHLQGTRVRVHLTNRYNPSPMTFGKVTIGVSQANGGVIAPVAVTFGGRRSVTAGAGQDVVSDPVDLSFDAFTPLAVSIYVPSIVWQLTKHWNSNATTYLTPFNAGDATGSTDGGAFTRTAQSWLGVLALDVEAPASTRAIVAFGDSLTDGWVASTASSGLDPSVSDTNARYPDFLQHRVDAAGLPLSIINAGIGSNQILGSIFPIAGPSGLSRFDHDVPYFATARGVIIFEGINDLGLSQATSGAVIGGLKELIATARADGLAVWLATITPASNAQVDGVDIAPNSERYRQLINQWIRTQTDADGYFDFDAAVRDPSNPAVLASQYSSVDHLHLSPAGYERLASVVDLDALASTSC
jgi:lysophospholipase L1-like esterase